MAIDFPVAFTKMSGAGNDFIVIDHRIPLIPEAEQPEFARLVCRRMFSVGADGLILIENSARLIFAGAFITRMGPWPRCAVTVPGARPVLPLPKGSPGLPCCLKPWRGSLRPGSVRMRPSSRPLPIPGVGDTPASLPFDCG